MAPWILLLAAFLAAVHLLDSFYGFLLLWNVRILFLAAAVSATVAVEITLTAAAIAHRASAPVKLALLTETLAARRDLIILTTLAAVGILASLARSAPVGDDLGMYTDVALALLEGSPYPAHMPPDVYVSAGMTQVDPVMPVLPVLMIGTFAVFGKTLSGVAVALAVTKSLFPVLMYFACLALTGSRPAAFATAILAFLFPVYQFHSLGAPEPDALFADMLLLVAALAATALKSRSWVRWLALGVAMGLMASTRHEGLNFLEGTVLVYFGLQRPRWQYIPLALSCLLVLAPFSAVSMATAGMLWPTYAGTLSPSSVLPNLVQIGDLSLPWYVQAVGLPAPLLGIVVVMVAGCVAASAPLLWKHNRPLLFIPVLGGGYIAASLLIHPQVLNPGSPVDLFRHWSSGVPYVVLSAAYALHHTYRAIERRMDRSRAFLLALGATLAIAGALYYECDRLAWPEWHFGGRASLLWTGDTFALADVLQHPVPLPARNDPRSGEELRDVQTAPIREFSIRLTNRSEPYYVASLWLGLAAIGCVAWPSLAKRRERGPSSTPARERTLAAGRSN